MKRIDLLKTDRRKNSVVVEEAGKTVSFYECDAIVNLPDMLVATGTNAMQRQGAFLSQPPFAYDPKIFYGLPNMMSLQPGDLAKGVYSKECLADPQAPSYLCPSFFPSFIPSTPMMPLVRSYFPHVPPFVPSTNGLYSHPLALPPCYTLYSSSTPFDPMQNVSVDVPASTPLPPHSTEGVKKRRVILGKHSLPLPVDEVECGDEVVFEKYSCSPSVEQPLKDRLKSTLPGNVPPVASVLSEPKESFDVTLDMAQRNYHGLSESLGSSKTPQVMMSGGAAATTEASKQTTRKVAPIQNDLSAYSVPNCLYFGLPSSASARNLFEGCRGGVSGSRPVNDEGESTPFSTGVNTLYHPFKTSLKNECSTTEPFADECSLSTGLSGSHLHHSHHQVVSNDLRFSDAKRSYAASCQMSADHDGTQDNKSLGESQLHEERPCRLPSYSAVVLSTAPGESLFTKPVTEGVNNSFSCFPPKDNLDSTQSCVTSASPAMRPKEQPSSMQTLNGKATPSCSVERGALRCNTIAPLPSISFSSCDLVSEQPNVGTTVPFTDEEEEDLQQVPGWVPEYSSSLRDEESSKTLKKKDEVTVDAIQHKTKEPEENTTVAQLATAPRTQIEGHVAVPLALGLIKIYHNIFREEHKLKERQLDVLLTRFLPAVCSELSSPLSLYKSLFRTMLESALEVYARSWSDVRRSQSDIIQKVESKFLQCTETTAMLVRCTAMLCAALDHFILDWLFQLQFLGDSVPIPTSKKLVYDKLVVKFFEPDILARRNHRVQAISGLFCTLSDILVTGKNLTLPTSLQPVASSSYSSEEEEEEEGEEEKQEQKPKQDQEEDQEKEQATSFSK